MRSPGNHCPVTNWRHGREGSDRWEALPAARTSPRPMRFRQIGPGAHFDQAADRADELVCVVAAGVQLVGGDGGADQELDAVVVEHVDQPGVLWVVPSGSLVLIACTSGEV